MSEGWENVDRSIRDIDPNLIVIQLDLPRLGELIARVADTLCKLREIEPFDVDSEEASVLAIDGWRYVCHMTDRAEFARSVQSDLSKLDAPISDTPKGVSPEHRPEFGGAATPPLGWNPPV